MIKREKNLYQCRVDIIVFYYYRYFLNFFFLIAFSEYKACIAPACTDITVDKSLGTIDPFSLLVRNEYIFIKVNHFSWYLTY